MPTSPIHRERVEQHVIAVRKEPLSDHQFRLVPRVQNIHNINWIRHNSSFIIDLKYLPTLSAVIVEKD